MISSIVVEAPKQLILPRTLAWVISVSRRWNKPIWYLQVSSKAKRVGKRLILITISEKTLLLWQFFEALVCLLMVNKSCCLNKFYKSKFCFNLTVWLHGKHLAYLFLLFIKTSGPWEAMYIFSGGLAIRVTV